MRSNHILIVLSIVAAMAAVVVVVSAGDPDNPPGPPETTSSYRLEDIYSRLDTGAAGTPITFTEPISGPTAGTGHTLDEIMAVAPSVDDTNGATTTQVVSGTTYWGLRNGAWGLQIGTMPDSAGVPKTGQTTSDATGDDGDLEMGVEWPSPRFTDNGDGTVTDNLTGLVWLENANCFGTRNWTGALSDANGLATGSCGLTDGSSAGDWRLPNVRELQSLIDYGVDFPALPDGHPFTGVESTTYWSSTANAYYTSYAWSVYLSFGSVSYGSMSNTYYVWPVRGGQ